MSDKKYIVKYRASKAASPGVGEGRFLQFLESLNEAEWHALLLDSMREHPDSRRVFLPAKGDTVVTSVCSFVGRLGLGTQRVVANAVERLVNHEDPVISVTAVFVAGILPSSLTKHFLMGLVLRESVSAELRE